jgi:hypothetical protein
MDFCYLFTHLERYHYNPLSKNHSKSTYTPILKCKAVFTLTWNHGGVYINVEPRLKFRHEDVA